MTELAQRLQEAGDASSMTELEGKTFQILSFKMGQRDSTFSEGTYLYADTELLIEEDSGLVEARVELSGARVCRQIQTLTDGDLPARVRLVRRLDLKGVPWDLLAVVGGEAAPVAEAPKGSPLVERAKNAGAKAKARGTVVSVRRKGGAQTDMEWDEFCGLWQKAGYGLDELADVCGASGAKAVTHWFAADKDRTITMLKVEAEKRRKPLGELPFE